ncbi:hypothetical protein LSH36_1589g00003 [Paralvinella palmiformis]|uniref:MULE transposase domain-containing protein n=1 Tax=Paralvinella palmiformis TaxID=53620 RepID=A0AAD9MQB7_9ANNE|nr:hypothetical protein LSH36_1589g00003 [Paralvinella palmiformis]
MEISTVIKELNSVDEKAEAYVEPVRFIQMFSVHVYMSHEDYTKQVPFVTSMIFCHSKQDYITIFHSILEGSTSPPQAQRVVLDYEEAIWRYIRTVMPSFHIKGPSWSIASNGACLLCDTVVLTTAPSDPDWPAVGWQSAN